MEIRNNIVKILNVISPLLGAYAVHYKKVNFLRVLNTDLVKDISSSGEVAINIAIITVLINIIILIFKYPCKIKIDIINNRNKETTELLILDDQRPRKLNIKLKINYQNLLLKKIIRVLMELNIKIFIPPIMSYSISNKDEFTESITEHRDFFVINLDKLILDEEIKYTGNIEIVLLSNVNTIQNRQISSTLEKGIGKIKSLFFYIGVFLFMDLESNKHTVETIDYE